MSGPFRVLALGGDHIGPEVVESALKILHRAAASYGIVVDVDEDLLGGASWDKHGTFCTNAVAAKAKAADAILVGAVGGPEWDSIKIDGPITETDSLTRLRIERDVFNALRGRGNLFWRGRPIVRMWWRGLIFWSCAKTQAVSTTESRADGKP